MKSIIKVIVDIPIAKLDRPFDYLLPDRLENRIKVGHLVEVPFGKRKISAFVIDVDVQSEIEIKKLKEINKVLYEEKFFDKKMLKLFKWAAKYYHSYLIQVIRAAIPPGIMEQKIKKKNIRCLKLTSKAREEKLINNLKKRAPKQYEIMKYFL